MLLATPRIRHRLASHEAPAVEDEPRGWSIPTLQDLSWPTSPLSSSSLISTLLTKLQLPFGVFWTGQFSPQEF